MYLTTHQNIILSLEIKLRRWTVDRTNSGSSLIVGFNFKGIEVADSINRELAKFAGRLLGRCVL